MTSGTEMVLTATGLGKRYRRVWALRDCSLAIPAGRVVALVGPNGAGKTTLLHLAVGLLTPTQGGLRLFGTPPGVPATLQRVAFMAQDRPLYDGFTVADMLRFGRHLNPQWDQDFAEKRLSMLDIPLDRRVGKLSGGQQAQVALSVALGKRPDLLLLDEPLAALDVDATPAMRALLRRVVRAAGQTAVLVTHSALDALVLADRVVVLTEGRVVEHGDTREVLARPRSPFTARIAGLDLVPGAACPGGIRTADGTVVAGRDGGIADGEPAVAVFPPSAVAVFAERPHGSPRNVLPVQVAAIEPHGDVVRLRAAPAPGGPAWVDGLAADVTPAAVAELGAEPGVRLWFAVKATEVAIHGGGVKVTR
jgi:molybdate transport system ATP-binding protein